MPWVPVDPRGFVAAFAYCPADYLECALNHQVTAEDLMNKTQGQVWRVKFGEARDGDPSAAAEYKVLNAPSAASGRDTWKVGVSYWSLKSPQTQWLWVRPCASRGNVHVAKDYFSVSQVLPQQHGSGRPPVNLEPQGERQDEQQDEPQEEPPVNVHRQG